MAPPSSVPMLAPSPIAAGADEGDVMSGEVFDMNADGVADGVAYDTNADGYLDRLDLDQNQDGWIDTNALDTNADGVLDTYLVDSNQNGIVDAYAYDTDGDAVLDTAIADSNENGVDDSSEASADDVHSAIISATVVGGTPTYDGAPGLLNGLAEQSGTPTWGTPSDWDGDGRLDGEDPDPSDPLVH